jgi:hypothetical protein
MDMKTLHEWLDLMVTSSNERFDQVDLAQTAAKTTFDVVVARLDALHTTITELQKHYGGDSELDVRDSCSRARCVARHPAGTDSFSTIKFKIPPFNSKYNVATYLDWELEVEQKFWESKGKEPRRVQAYIPHQIPKRKASKPPHKNHQERAPKITKKEKRDRHNQALRKHAESSIDTMKVHTRSSLPPDHPSLSQDLTMKLSSYSWKFQKKTEGGIGKLNDLGFQEMVAILSPLGLYGGNRKTKLPIRPNTRIHAPEGHYGNHCLPSIGRLPSDCKLA